LSDDDIVGYWRTNLPRVGEKCIVITYGVLVWTDHEEVGRIVTDKSVQDAFASKRKRLIHPVESEMRDKRY